MEYTLTPEDEARLEAFDDAPPDSKLRPKKIELIHDYFRVIILQRQIYIAEHTSLPANLKYNISLPTTEKLNKLNDAAIEALLNHFSAYEKLKITEPNLVSAEHNQIILKINDIVTPTPGGGKKTRRKRAKRHTRR